MSDEARSDRGRPAAGVVAIALVAAMAVVAMAARAPLSRSSAVDASSANAPLTALLLVLAGGGALVVAAWLARSLAGTRRDQDVEPEYVPQRPPIHWLWKALAILVPFAMGASLVATALLGTRTAASHPGLTAGGATRRPPSATPRTHAVYSVPGWLPWVLLAVAVAAVAVGWMLVARRRPGPPVPQARDDAARASVDVAIEALQHRDDPRSALIAAYLAMERTLADRGVARAPAEAPREYLRRALGRTGGAETEATLITSLFEEARFSTHAVSERLRSQARAALSSLREHLSAGGAG